MKKTIIAICLIMIALTTGGVLAGLYLTFYEDHIEAMNKYQASISEYESEYKPERGNSRAIWGDFTPRTIDEAFMGPDKCSYMPFGCF